MASRVGPAPHVHHASLSAKLAPSEAQSFLNDFISSTHTKPHLHPDSVLTPSGVQFPPTSGPGGGLALHHLRRIAEGLGGVNLVPETWEELAKFGVEEDEEIGGGGADGYSNGFGRKRSRDDIEKWAETSSQIAEPMAETAAELEGFAMDYGDWQSQEQFEKQQTALHDEIGDRMGATALGQNGGPPKIDKTHPAGGLNGDGAKKHRTEGEKAQRKAEKAARKLDERRKKAKVAG